MFVRSRILFGLVFVSTSAFALALPAEAQRVPEACGNLYFVDVRVPERTEDFANPYVQPFLQADRLRELLAVANRCVAERGGSFDFGARAAIHLALGDERLAEADATRRVQIGGSAAAHFARAWIYWRMGRYAEAIADYERAVSLDPARRGIVYPEMIRTLALANRLPDALRVAETAAREHPDSSAILEARYDALVRHEQYEAAEPVLAEIRRRWPNSAYSDEGTRILQMTRRGNHQEALAAAEALRTQEETADNLNLIGFIRLQSDLYREAAEILRRAVARQRNHEDAQFNLCDALAELPDEPEAIPICTGVLSSSTSSLDRAAALRLLGRAHLVRGDRLRAIEFLERSLAEPGISPVSRRRAQAALAEARQDAPPPGDAPSQEGQP